MENQTPAQPEQKTKLGRPRLFDENLTGADRVQRHREKKVAEKKLAADKLAVKQAKLDELEEIRQASQQDLRWFGEESFDVNAKTAHAEIEIHRSFLRALNEYDPNVQPDVLPGETLRELAKRVWAAYSNSSIVSHSGTGKIWFPLFSPKLGKFQHWHGVAIKDAEDPGWFERHWVPPADTTGDTPITL